MSLRFPYRVYLNENGVLDKSSFKKLYKNYKKYDTGIIVASDNECDVNLKLKTELIKGEYSVTTIYASIGPSNSPQKVFLVFAKNSVHNLKKSLIELAEKYNRDFITYFNRNSNTYFLIDTKSKTETKLETPMFTDKGYLNYENPEIPFKFNGFADGAVNFDCDKSVYGFNGALCMSRFSDYVVSK